MGGAGEEFYPAAHLSHHQPPSEIVSDYFPQPPVNGNGGFLAENGGLSFNLRQQQLPAMSNLPETNLYRNLDHNPPLYNYSGDSYGTNLDHRYYGSGSFSQDFNPSRSNLDHRYPGGFQETLFDRNLEIDFRRLNLASNQGGSPISAPSPLTLDVLRQGGTCRDLCFNRRGAIRLNLRALSDDYQKPIQLRDRARAYSGLLTQSRDRQNFPPLEELRGAIFRVAQDQDGCRFLQRKCEEGKPEDIELIFAELKDHVRELMVDSSMKHLFQKLFKVCNQSHMNHIVASIVTDDAVFMSICLNSHGTREMQNVIENLITAEQRSLIASAVRRITVPLIKNMNGHHVIQHCLKSFRLFLQQILNVVADNCLNIAIDKTGCCVLQQCVLHANGRTKKRILDEIIAHALLLSEHPYGFVPLLPLFQFY